MKFFPLLFLLLASVHMSFSQVRIINNTDFNYELVFITPANKSLDTKGVCFEIINGRQNENNLNSRESITISYKPAEGVRYDLFLVDTSKWGGYEHTACLHSIVFDKTNTVTVINDSVPKPFFYHCEERKMYENETLLQLTLLNTSSCRIIEFSYAIDDLQKFITHRYLVPWQPLQSNQSGTYYLTHIKRDGIETELKLKFKFEQNGVFKEKQVSLKFTGDKMNYTFTE